MEIEHGFIFGHSAIDDADVLRCDARQCPVLIENADGIGCKGNPVRCDSGSNGAPAEGFGGKINLLADRCHTAPKVEVLRIMPSLIEQPSFEQSSLTSDHTGCDDGCVSVQEFGQCHPTARGINTHESPAIQRSGPE